MNAGMYGMADGRGMAGRKLAGQVMPASISPGVSAGTVLAMAASQSRSPESVNLSAGVRTKVLSVSGLGALRMAGWSMSAQVANITYELWLDGILIKKYTNVSVASGADLVLAGVGVGSNAYPDVSADFIPFESSCEIFVTSDVPVSGGNGRHFYWVDVHK